MPDPKVRLIAQWICAAFPFDSVVTPPAFPPIESWDALAHCAEENAIAPLLYASLKKFERDQDLPTPIRERLRLDYLRADTANWNALKELQNLIAAFERAEISVVVLKGAALAPTLYPDPALRPMGDLDILIPREQFARADTLLRDQNFSFPVELCRDFAPRLTNYRAYTRSGNNPAHIEAHWHLFKSPYYWRRVPIEWFWEHTTTHPTMRVFTPDAQFLHLAAHFALHHHSERSIWSYDIARLLASENAALNWDALLDAVERFGLVAPVRVALARVAETWDVCAPLAAVTRLNASRTLWRDRAAFALMNVPRNEVRFILDAISQPSAGDKVRFVWYHLFPSAAYIQERYRVRAGWQIPLFYARRFIQGALKFFRSTWLAVRA